MLHANAYRIFFSYKCLVVTFLYLELQLEFRDNTLNNYGNFETSLNAYLFLLSVASCNFDNSMCGFVQDRNDKFDWKRHRGSTRSYRTGPSADHTTGRARGGGEQNLPLPATLNRNSLKYLLCSLVKKINE